MSLFTEAESCKTNWQEGNKQALRQHRHRNYSPALVHHACTCVGVEEGSGASGLPIELRLDPEQGREVRVIATVRLGLGGDQLGQ